MRRSALSLSILALSACASDVYPADVARRDVVDVVDVACPTDRPIRCNGECVGDTDTNPLHCGATCTMCNVPDHGSATCSSGMCGIRCSPGYVAMDGRCVALPPPRPTRPLTNARVSVTQPTLHWANPEGTHAAHITVCRDRACTAVVTEFDADGTSARVPNALGAGVWFWNLRAIDAGVASPTRSATWSFHTPAVSGPVEWSWAERPDFNGDGIDDLTADIPDGAGGASTLLFLGGPAVSRPGMPISDSRLQPVGDVNGDGFSDFASVRHGAATLFAGGSAVTIQELSDARIAGLDYFGWGASTGDFDGDGFGDSLLIGDRGFLVAHGSPTGWTRLEPLVGLESLAIAFDVDADGFDDVIASDRWWRGGGADLGTARMVATRVFGIIVFPMGDLDRDGYLDAVQLAETAPLVLLRGSVDGPMPVVADPSTPVVGQHSAFGDAGDLDGDSVDDLLFWSPGTNAPVACRGTSSGYSHSDCFTPTLPCVPGMYDTMARAHRIGDFDASGHEDYVLLCQTSGEVFLHLDANTPRARWVPLPAPHASVIE